MHLIRAGLWRAPVRPGERILRPIGPAVRPAVPGNGEMVTVSKVDAPENVNVLPLPLASETMADTVPELTGGNATTVGCWPLTRRVAVDPPAV